MSRAPVQQLGEQELRMYVARHENDYVQEYVDALYEERAELTSQIQSIVRDSYSEDGRRAMRTVQRVLLAITIVAVAVIAFTLGRLTG
ncbi:MAG TPA: hypothetical protein VFP15_15035 [Gemmatimonadaceae bacterium]|nr:hypothetical protein [Gemmatimonadaceae bacterium]